MALIITMSFDVHLHLNGLGLSSFLRTPTEPDALPQSMFCKPGFCIQAMIAALHISNAI